MIRVDFDFPPIPDLGVKKAQDPEHRSSYNPVLFGTKGNKYPWWYYIYHYYPIFSARPARVFARRT